MLVAVLVGAKNINFILGIIASYVKALGSWCNIFMRIQCNIVASHIRLVMLSSSRLQTICVQIYFTFVFLSLKSSFFLFKMFAHKPLTMLLLDEDDNLETFSKKSRKRWVRPWLGQSCLDVFIHYSKKTNLIRKPLKGL